MNRRHRLAVLAAVAAFGLPTLSWAQASLSLAESRSNFTGYVGTLNASDGFDDRNYGGFFYNQYFGAIGVHADVVTIQREDDSTFATVGMSWDAGSNLRPKIMLGSSTDNRDIHPEVYVSAQVQIRPTSDSRTIVTPSMTYRKFRTGAEEFTPSLDAVYYFSIPSDTSGYYVAQAGLSASFADRDENGFTVGAGLQTVRANGVSFGAYVEGGRLVYDDLIGSGLETDFYSIRPAVGLRFTPETELFFRGEYTHTDFYDLAGVLVGFKLTF